MARKKVREYDGKRILLNHIRKRVKLGASAGRSAQVTRKDISSKKDNGKEFYDSLAKKQPWLLREKLVVKPDMLFGKRGKNNLVLLNADYAAAQEFIAERMGQSLEISGVEGELTTFIIEQFVPHQEEFYLSIQSHRTHDTIRFGNCGGVEIEDNWHLVKDIDVPIPPSSDSSAHVVPTEEINKLVHQVTKGVHAKVLADFIGAIYGAFVELDGTMVEMNPFAIDMEALPVILDIRVELDTYATFRHAKAAWKGVEFPEPWGRTKCPEEQLVQDMDDRSGASLKLSVLNPEGKIWTMVAGGGASVIYADQVVQVGLGDELANYAEYSGNPKENETYLYARTLLSLATNNPGDHRRALLVGGGVANFSDIAATLGGVQQAITDFHGKLQMAKVKVFVRRGGPNYKAGLQLMRDLGNNLDIPIDVYGPDTNMTHIVTLAKRWIEEGI